MLFGDALSRTEILPSLLAVLDEEAKSWPKQMRALIVIARAKVSSLAVRYVPRLKASVYCAGLAHLTVLEVAPLLTALLLAGRIGGSYAGEVATMQGEVILFTADIPRASPAHDLTYSHRSDAPKPPAPHDRHLADAVVPSSRRRRRARRGAAAHRARRCRRPRRRGLRLSALWARHPE